MDVFADRTLALAGIFQAARLTQTLAREGTADKAAFGASVQSVLQIDAPTVEAVYGGTPGVTLGLALLRDKLAGNTTPNDLEMARYAITLMQIESALGKRQDLLGILGRGIETAKEQMKFFEKPIEEAADGVHPALVEKLAELYQQTISTLTPRVMVNGEHGYLANAAIAAKVRTALLAGVRSAVLWRQKGGSRWQLLFQRNKIVGEAKRLLAEARDTVN
jgi:high frequency lysogenization protein